jgi:hypothetical protein
MSRRHAMADKANVGVKSAGPAASHQDREQISAINSKITVWWPNFMLRTPRPAEKHS